MSKMQKVWLWIFIAMFTIPEMLWSPIINDLYEYSQSGKVGAIQSFRNTVLQKSDSYNLLSTVLLIQFLGLLGLFVYLIVIRKSIKNTLFFWPSIILTFLGSVITIILFGLSASLRSIGF